MLWAGAALCRFFSRVGAGWADRVAAMGRPPGQLKHLSDGVWQMAGSWGDGKRGGWRFSSRSIAFRKPFFRWGPG